MGRTPGKGTKTGREVIERMEKDGKIRRDPKTGEPIEFMDSKNEWRNIKDADMSHNTDAVKYWNEGIPSEGIAPGRSFGARSPEVREWMLDSKNYTLDYFSYNHSAGSALPDRYLPPLKGVGA